MILLAKLRAHFYTGNYICLYRATCGAVPDFEEFQSGNIAKSQISDKGIISPCGTRPILLQQLKIFKITEVSMSLLWNDDLSFLYSGIGICEKTGSFYLQKEQEVENLSRAKNPKYESMSLEELKVNMEKVKKNWNMRSIIKIFWSRERSWQSERNVPTD